MASGSEAAVAPERKADTRRANAKGSTARRSWPDCECFEKLCQAHERRRSPIKYATQVQPGSHWRLLRLRDVATAVCSSISVAGVATEAVNNMPLSHAVWGDLDLTNEVHRL